MSPHLLIKALIEQSQETTMAIARKMDSTSFQGTLHKYINGKVPNPRHDTARKIAGYFELPIEAMYNEDLALKIAIERGVKVRRVNEPQVTERPTTYDLPKTKPQALSPSTMKRIAALTPKQCKALESMIDVWLDSVAPAQPGKQRQA